MRTRLLLAPALAASLLHAQAPAKPASVAAENDHVRVIKAHLGPGEETKLHEHPARVVVFLTDASLDVTLPDGTTRRVERKAETVEAVPPTRHVVKNAAAKPFEAVEIELKAPASARPLGDAVAEDPKHAVLLLENDRVRVLRTRVSPGDATAMHGHGERVTVILSGGRMKTTGEDGTSRETDMAAGDVAIGPPTRHVAANVAKTLHDAITIELKPAPAAAPEAPKP